MPKSDTPRSCIDSIVNNHGQARKRLLPILHHTANTCGHLDESTVRQIARALAVSPAEVYGTATFFSFLHTQPVGTHVVRICRNISCHVAGKQEIVDAIEDLLQTRLGTTTADGRFAFLATNCLGWCHKGPAMLIDGKPHTELTAETARDVLRTYMQKGERHGD